MEQKQKVVDTQLVFVKNKNQRAITTNKIFVKNTDELLQQVQHYFHEQQMELLMYNIGDDEGSVIQLEISNKDETEIRPSNGIQERQHSKHKFSYDSFLDVEDPKSIRLEEFLCASLKWGSSVTDVTVENLKGYLYHLSFICQMIALRTYSLKTLIKYDQMVRKQAEYGGWDSFKEDSPGVKSVKYRMRIGTDAISHSNIDQVQTAQEEAQIIQPLSEKALCNEDDLHAKASDHSFSNAKNENTDDNWDVLSQGSNQGITIMEIVNKTPSMSLGTSDVGMIGDHTYASPRATRKEPLSGTLTNSEIVHDSTQNEQSVKHVTEDSSQGDPKVKTVKKEAQTPEKIKCRKLKKGDQSMHSDTKSHKCSECDMAFKRSSTLTIHMFREHNHPGFVCSHCGSKHPTRSSLNQHELTHSGVTRFSCTVCGKGFSRRSKLKSHEAIHTGEQNFMCAECGKRFNVKANHQRHMLIHTGETPYKCKDCDQSFNHPHKLIKHTASEHLGSMQHVCSFCQKSFFYPGLLKEHIQVHIIGKPSCQYCLKEFANNYNLKNHIITFHGDQNHGFLVTEKQKITEKLHLCSECGRKFANKATLTEHFRSHTGEMPFVCTHCNKAFRVKGILTEHLKTHTGEQPYKCRYCERIFSIRGNRNRHERTHSGEKPFLCSLCAKLFAQHSQLNRHMKYHQGQKDHKCEACGKSFVERATLSKHLLTHTGE